MLGHDRGVSLIDLHCASLQRIECARQLAQLSNGGFGCEPLGCGGISAALPPRDGADCVARRVDNIATPRAAQLPCPVQEPLLLLGEARRLHLDIVHCQLKLFVCRGHPTSSVALAPPHRPRKTQHQASRKSQRFPPAPWQPAPDSAALHKTLLPPPPPPSPAPSYPHPLPQAPHRYLRAD
eukprot:scaffold2774_cov137-Isochrysis_galbana.AAC.6